MSDTQQPKIDGNRITALILDALIVSLLNAVLMISVGILPMILGFASPETLKARLFIAIGISSAVLILRDCFPKCGIGKRAMHLKIVCKKSGKNASFLQKIARNVFLVISPIEAVVYLCNGERLGDKTVGTKVIGTKAAPCDEETAPSDAAAVTE